MPLIEQYQKQVLFEEASRAAISTSRILAAAEIYDDLLGLTDIGAARYGHPLAPVYTAVAGETIEVPRMSAFFRGVDRDLRVLDLAVGSMETQLADLNLEMWARMELVKNRANSALKQARTEKLRSSAGASWAFTEGFTSTVRLDMERTTAWIDAAEGVCLLPNASPEQAVLPEQVVVVSSQVPEGGSPVGSAPQQAFDGLESTSWRTLFVLPNGQPAQCVAQLAAPADVTAVTVDPIGFGLDVTIEADAGTGFKEIVRGLVYARKTFAVETDGVLQIRVSYLPVASTLPSAVGLREITLYTSKSTNAASVYSLPMRPSEPFVDVQLDLKAQLPGGSSVRAYVRTRDTDPWLEVQPGAWTPIVHIDANRRSINVDDAQPNPVFRGLYGVSLTGATAASQGEGTLEVGEGQIEATAFDRDWSDVGDAPHVLAPEEFDLPTAKKTWAPVRRAVVSPTEYVVQPYGATTLSAAGLVRGTDLAFRRAIQKPVAAGSAGRGDAPYGELCVVPLGGDRSKNAMQFGYNYRLRFHVHCKKQLFYGSTLDSEGTFAKYWFLQGYRKDGARPYREVGKSWGAFSLYINDQLVTGDSAPYTIYASGQALREPGAALGRPFAFTLNEGWNVVELLVSVVDPSSDATTFNDPLDLGDPYLQLSITPDFFNEEFQRTYGIDRVLASGPRPPVNEFDLLWNLPRDASYWCWSETKDALLFNSADPMLIDGFFRGSMPRCTLDYRSAYDVPADLMVRLDMQRDPLSRTGPILDEYRLMVK